MHVPKACTREHSVIHKATGPMDMVTDCSMQNRKKMSIGCEWDNTPWRAFLLAADNPAALWISPVADPRGRAPWHPPRPRPCKKIVIKKMAAKGGRIDFMFLAPHPLPGHWIRYWSLQIILVYYQGHVLGHIQSQHNCLLVQIEMIYDTRASPWNWSYLLRVDSRWKLCNTHCLFTLKTFLIGYLP